MSGSLIGHLTFFSKFLRPPAKAKLIGLSSRSLNSVHITHTQLRIGKIS